MEQVGWKLDGAGAGLGILGPVPLLLSTPLTTLTNSSWSSSVTLTVSRPSIFMKSGAEGLTVSPTPPKKGGTHRYIFVLFKQNAPGKLSGFSPNKAKPRVSWDAAGFLKANAGKLEAVAYNFFYATSEVIGGPMDGAAARADSGLLPPKAEL